MSSQLRASPVPDPRRWWALGLLSVAQFLVILDTSIIGVALPAIKDALGFSTVGLQWVFNAYVIAFGGLLLLGGRLADLLGPRRVFAAGFAVLAGSSLLAGLAPTSGVLVAGRALMGAGAEVVIQGGHLMLKPLTPIPTMRRGFRLYPDDPDDPWLFRLSFPEFGMNLRVVFDAGPEAGPAGRLLLDLMSLQRRPDLRNPRPWVSGVVAAGLAALAVRGLKDHRRSGEQPR